MKILHIASEYPPQKVFGLGRFVRDLAEEQVKQGHRVTVITNSLGGDLAQTKQNGVQVLRVDHPPPPKPVSNSGCIMVFNILCMKRALSIGPEQLSKFDAICSHDWLTAPAAEALHKAFGPPHITTFHDTTHGKRMGNLTDDGDRFSVDAERWCAHTASHVIANSEATRKELITTYQTEASRISVVPCAISPSTFPTMTDPIRLTSFRESFASKEELLVLYVGRLDPEKGLEILLEGFHRAQLPQAKLFIAGSGGLQEQLQKYVLVQGLEGQVKFLGYVENPGLAHLYRSADVLVCPSRYEPFGMVALEGMLQETPVILSKTGGLADLIEDCKEGFFVEPGKPAEIAMALRRCFANRQQLKTMGQAAKQRVLERHTWPHAAKATSRIYRDFSKKGKIQKVLPIDSLFVAANLNDTGGYSIGRQSRTLFQSSKELNAAISVVTSGPDDLFPIRTTDRHDGWILAGLNLGATLLSRSRHKPRQVVCHHWHSVLASLVLRGIDSKLPIHYLATSPDNTGYSAGQKDHVQEFEGLMAGWTQKVASEVTSTGEFISRTEKKPCPGTSIHESKVSAQAFAPVTDLEFFRSLFAKEGEFILLTALRLEPPFSPEAFLQTVRATRRADAFFRWILCGDGVQRNSIQEIVRKESLAVTFMGYLPQKVLSGILRIADGAVIPYRTPYASPFIQEAVEQGIPTFVPFGTNLIVPSSQHCLHEVSFVDGPAVVNAIVGQLHLLEPAAKKVEQAHPIDAPTSTIPSQVAQQPATANEIVLYNNWGIGDELLLSAVAREIKRTYPEKRLWIKARHGFQYPDFCEKTQPPISAISIETIYQNPNLYGPKHHSPFPGHLVQQMLDKVALDIGIRVKAQEYRPEIMLPRQPVNRDPELVVLHCRPNGRLPSKDWGMERWRVLCERLHSSRYRIVQVGPAEDPLLPRVIDKRGMPLLQLPELFLHASAIVCLVGMLMHLAAATRTPAVVIYGGREHPAIDGYPDQVHLASEPMECRGRWGCHLDPDVECPHGMKCMNSLTPNLVHRFVTKLLPVPAGVLT